MKKKIFLSVFLSFVCLISVFGFLGCNETSAEALTKKFENLDAVYQRYSDTFVVEGEQDSQKFTFNRKVDFGDTINNLAQQGEDNFGDLQGLYNVAFVISNDYIAQNYEYVCDFLENEKNISKDINSKVDALSKSLDAYTNQIKVFVSNKVVFQGDVEKYKDAGGDLMEKSIQSELTSFKKTFGRLVEANVQFSTDLAEAVEATKIYELLENLDDPFKADVAIVRDFIRAKMLHLFTDFKLTEFANQMTWSVDLDKDKNNPGKMRINDLVEALDDQYEFFKENFVLSKLEYGGNERAPKGAISDILDKSQAFLLEAETYSKALKEINFYNLVVNNDSDMEEYVKSNKFAEVYMQKLEQFVSFTLPDFMSNISKTISNLINA